MQQHGKDVYRGRKGNGEAFGMGRETTKTNLKMS